MIARYFSPAYRQIVDGNVLDYPAFIRHMALLKTMTQRMTLTILAIAAEGNTVLTHHRVDVEKRDRTQLP